MQINDLLGSSFKLDAAHVRTILGSVFNRDITSALETNEVSDIEAVVLVAAKMLMNAGFSLDLVQSICRLSKESICNATWTSYAPTMLNIADNRYVVLHGKYRSDVVVYDFRTGEKIDNAAMKPPLLIISINLSELMLICQHLPTQSRAPKVTAAVADVTTPSVP